MQHPAQKTQKSPNGTFTLTGKLMDSCDGPALANMPLKINHRNLHYPLSSGPHDSIGLGTTDANGYFSIVCQNWGWGEISIYGSGNHFGTVIIKSSDKPKGTTINIGTSYLSIFNLNIRSTLKLRISGTYSPTDTLYIGGKPIYPVTTGTRDEYLVIPYIQDTKHIIYFDEALNQPKATTIYWAIGKAAYDSVVKNKVVAHQLSIPFTVCGVPEVITEVDIKN
jgi:hypothetical protein